MRRFGEGSRRTALRWLWTLVPVAGLLQACGAPEGDLGPKLDVAAAVVMECVDQQADDQNAYMEKRVFLEAQGWWGEKTTGQPIPTHGDAEHLHVAMCFPIHQKVKGVLPFRVRVMAHNLQGATIQNTLLHDPDGGGAYATIRWDQSVSTTTLTRWASASVNTADSPDGWREFRILTQVRRPDGAEIHVSSGWCWEIDNSAATPMHSGTCLNTGTRKNIMARGWYDCFEYKIAETKNWEYPWGGIIRDNDGYQMNIGAHDGAGDNQAFSRYEVRWDPEFHQGFKGNLIKSGTSPVTNQQITVGENLLTPGPHRLAIIATAGTSCNDGAGITPQNGEVSAVMMIPVMVN